MVSSTPGLVRRSHAAFNDIAGERIRSYHHEFITEEQWPAFIHEFRDWLRDCFEDSSFTEFHLFYRGPVAAGPLIGAMAVGRKPLNVYFHDDESSRYLFAYRVDRRLLQEA